MKNNSKVSHDDRMDSLEGNLIEIPCQDNISDILDSKGFSPIFSETRRDQYSISKYLEWKKDSDIIYSTTRREGSSVISRLKVPEHLSDIIVKEPIVIDFAKAVGPEYFKNINTFNKRT